MRNRVYEPTETEKEPRETEYMSGQKRSIEPTETEYRAGRNGVYEPGETESGGQRGNYPDA